MPYDLDELSARKKIAVTLDQAVLHDAVFFKLRQSVQFGCLRRHFAGIFEDIALDFELQSI